MHLPAALAGPSESANGPILPASNAGDATRPKASVRDMAERIAPNMATDTITIRITVAWWFAPYVHALALVCAVMGTEPDWRKLERMCCRALRVNRG